MNSDDPDRESISEQPMRFETAVIALGRPPAVPDGPVNLPITPASALQAGGVSGYARDGHAPWQALEEVLGALEGGQAVTFASGMAAASAAMRLFDASSPRRSPTWTSAAPYWSSRR
jgi:cystathionine gamma-synthase